MHLIVLHCMGGPIGLPANIRLGRKCQLSTSQCINLTAKEVGKDQGGSENQRRGAREKKGLQPTKNKEEKKQKQTKKSVGGGGLEKVCAQILSCFRKFLFCF
jgi:hypothetical protein